MSDKSKISLKGKTAFISGASKGIGVEIARNFAQCGADLALSGRSPEGLALTADMARKFGVKVWTGTADFIEVEQVQSLAQNVLDDLGRIDILVNNAGLSIPAMVLDIDIDAWNRMYQVNVVAPLILTQAFVPGMIERKHGKVINITSRTALKGHARMGAYGSAKSALQQISASMAIEFGPHNIQVNCIAPVVTMTSMGRANWKPGPRTETKLAGIPAGRFAEPEEIADSALFLASDLSDFVNGTILPVDGGEGA